METTDLFESSLDLEHAQGDAVCAQFSTVQHWRAAYSRALDRVLSQECVRHDLIRLLVWPNLSRLPTELVVPVIRICALLWRKPTVGFLVPRVLKTSVHETCALLCVLQEFGHLTSPRQGLGPSELTGNEQEVALYSESTIQESDSLFGKLWSRLVGH